MIVCEKITFVNIIEKLSEKFIPYFIFLFKFFRFATEYPKKPNGFPSG